MPPRSRAPRWRWSPPSPPPLPSRRLGVSRLRSSRRPSTLYAPRRRPRRGSPPAAWFPNRVSSTARTAWLDYTRRAPQPSPHRLFTAIPCTPTPRLPSQANTQRCPTPTRTAPTNTTAATPSNCPPAPSNWTTGSGCPRPAWCSQRCLTLTVRAPPGKNRVRSCLML